MEALKARFPDLPFCPLRKPTRLNPATIHLPIGHVKAEGRRPLTVESVFARDVEVLMRDGINIYSDAFRSASSSDPGGQVPVIIASSPYGTDSSILFISHIHADYKQLIDTAGHSYDYLGPFRCGLKQGQTSGYESFEAPVPADWCARGYVVINPDSRGSFETFAKAKSTQKWLRVHHMQEWHDVYRKNNDELQKLFDRLRLSLLGFDGSPAKTIVERVEVAFPVPGTEYRTSFLDATTLTLSLEKSAAESNTSYEAHHPTHYTDFSVRFHEYIEDSGYPVVKL
ncbi:uncharacterized protein FPRO_15841 [Fusarium proliferatum ET1]|uniref:Uncharacterized protein n=1 Tax=Fusarium proliferatum (strain ET1) TaxID=1227346 RepID=A0A1L7WA47_FUSPR|nr:uncharacterized protein FPRO_15841 [Fusarium proliferatum ET1]CZR49481.1 uncharacterized protein FPRO_15841 [Fusarium proliferatum ET1]